MVLPTRRQQTSVNAVVSHRLEGLGFIASGAALALPSPTVSTLSQSMITATSSSFSLHTSMRIPNSKGKKRSRDKFTAIAPERCTNGIMRAVTIAYESTCSQTGTSNWNEGWTMEDEVFVLSGIPIAPDQA
ncbi:hypothetical protein K470DRAFT_30421 [Piedraia hortae CBS 480.64]|uniref:Uncharacterized protein n=1 Tax=Piedraia hortae CBS 480.64 TaxID=1314780 RepID=A0A6A7C488_9PEZI|nr:hypothetical protein K470DRAFT_30421 [Piedraia hortae CBS 480.64]